MKIQILDQHGKKAKEIESDIFSGSIREDIIQKIAEIEKKWQEYKPFYLAGQQTSASGSVKHNRHVWKSDRGKGLARIPKKTMARSGERFTWVGAVIPGTRGGRRAHPPKLNGKELKINKKEKLFGLKSALAMVNSLEMIKKKYQRISDKNISLKLPIVIDSKILLLKTKQIFEAIKTILKGAEEVINQEKSIRAGKGKIRGRKYKKTSGLLLVIGNKEDKKIGGIDLVKAKDLTIRDLASNGARLTIFTEESIKDLEKKLK